MMEMDVEGAKYPFEICRLEFFYMYILGFMIGCIILKWECVSNVPHIGDVGLTQRPPLYIARWINESSCEWELHPKASMKWEFYAPLFENAHDHIVGDSFGRRASAHIKYHILNEPFQDPEGRKSLGVVHNSTNYRLSNGWATQLAHIFIYFKQCTHCQYGDEVRNLLLVSGMHTCVEKNWTISEFRMMRRIAMQFNSLNELCSMCTVKNIFWQTIPYPHPFRRGRSNLPKELKATCGISYMTAVKYFSESYNFKALQSTWMLDETFQKRHHCVNKEGNGLDWHHMDEQGRDMLMYQFLANFAIRKKS